MEGWREGAATDHLRTPNPQEGPRPIVQSVIIWHCQRLDLLSGLGTHFVMAAFHSTGASRRLSVVTLRIRRYTCNRSMGTVTGVPEGKACSLHVSLSTGHSVVSESTLNSPWSHWVAELPVFTERGSSAGGEDCSGNNWDLTTDGTLWWGLVNSRVAAWFLC